LILVTTVEAKITTFLSWAASSTLGAAQDKDFAI